MTKMTNDELSKAIARQIEIYDRAAQKTAAFDKIDLRGYMQDPGTGAFQQRVARALLKAGHPEMAATFSLGGTTDDEVRLHHFWAFAMTQPDLTPEGVAASMASDAAKAYRLDRIYGA